MKCEVEKSNVMTYLVLLVAWRFFVNKQGTSMSTSGKLTSRDPCLGEGVYCIFEEYTLF